MDIAASEVTILSDDSIPADICMYSYAMNTAEIPSIELYIT